jgi:protein-S-isoprenylcysteine O-methyltransferase Ste14
MLESLFLTWPEIWVFIGFCVLYSVPTSLWLKKNNPKLMKKRLFLKRYSMGWKEWDKIVMSGLIVFSMVSLVIAGLDAAFRWSHVPLLLEVLGFAGIVPAFVVSFMVMRENTYLSKLSEIQKGQKVVTTGPYAYIRHPMYASFIIFFLCLPFALGSLYALIPGVLTSVFVVIRTHLEDKMLHKELPGYVEYKKKTRYRILPHVW